MPMIAAHETFESFIFIYVWNLLNPFDELLRYKKQYKMKYVRNVRYLYNNLSDRTTQKKKSQPAPLLHFCRNLLATMLGIDWILLRKERQFVKNVCNLERLDDHIFRCEQFVSALSDIFSCKRK